MAIILKGTLKPITAGRFKVRNRFLTGLPTQAKIAESVTYVGSERIAYRQSNFGGLATGWELTSRANLNNTGSSLLALLPDPPTQAGTITSNRNYQVPPTTIEWAYNFNEPYTGRVIVDASIVFGFGTYIAANPRYGSYTLQMYSGTSTLSGSSLAAVGDLVASHSRATTSMIPTVTVPTDIIFDVNVENCTGLYFRITDNVTYHDWGNAGIQSTHYLILRSIQLPDFPL